MMVSMCCWHRPPVPRNAIFSFSLAALILA
jgi:hypothetical protein